MPKCNARLCNMTAGGVAQFPFLPQVHELADPAATVEP
jgi:hypothetical protein